MSENQRRKTGGKEGRGKEGGGKKKKEREQGRKGKQGKKRREREKEREGKEGGREEVWQFPSYIHSLFIYTIKPNTGPRKQ